MNFCRYPSLELSWLPMSDRKTLPTPHVVMVDLPEVGGFFSPRGIPQRDYVPTNGSRDIIAISTHWNDSRIASTLAHEFRHMQQWYLPGLPKWPNSDGWMDFSDWDAAIKKFYRTRRYEMDALRYEYRLARDDTNERVREVLSVL